MPRGHRRGFAACPDGPARRGRRPCTHRVREGEATAPLVVAADKAGCEAVLALADVKTTHSAFPADEGYGYRRRGWYDDYDEDDDEYPGGTSDSGREYDIQELIDSEITLTHWTGPDGTRLEETSLSVDGDEVCASTKTGDLAAYSAEYEGYMGNWGNTLDRWYHRAAVVVWPRQHAFANRAETSPAWALDELAAIASAGDVPAAQAAAATLAPFWDGALRGRTAEEGGRVSGPGCPACAKACTPRAAPARYPRSGSLTWRGSGPPGRSVPGSRRPRPAAATRSSRAWVNRSPRCCRPPPRSGQPARGTRYLDLSGGRGTR